MTNSHPNGILIIEREVAKMKDIRLEMTCPFCGVDHHVDCREDQYNAYCNGELAQVAFDDLSATEREQIISHLCPSCQEKIFG